MVEAEAQGVADLDEVDLAFLEEVAEVAAYHEHEVAASYQVVVVASVHHMKEEGEVLFLWRAEELDLAIQAAAAFLEANHILHMVLRPFQVVRAEAACEVVAKELSSVH